MYLNDRKRVEARDLERIKNREISLDILKGFSIISVALYHFNAKVLPYGYLGVDLFLVINGYLITRSLTKKLFESEGKIAPFYINFIQIISM